MVQSISPGFDGVSSDDLETYILTMRHFILLLSNEEVKERSALQSSIDWGITEKERSTYKEHQKLLKKYRKNISDDIQQDMYSIMSLQTSKISWKYFARDAAFHLADKNRD